MKAIKYQLLIGLLSLFPVSASALFKLGVQGGLNLSSVSSDTAISGLANRNGLMAGAFLELDTGSFFSIQPELNYIQKGYTYLSGTTTTVAKVDFIEIPVFLRLNLPIPIISPYLFAGPAFGFRTKAESDLGSGTPTDISTTVEKNDISAAIGGGVDMSIAPLISLFANGRYSIGLKDIDTSATVAKTKGFQILAGLAFGI